MRADDLPLSVTDTPDNHHTRLHRGLDVCDLMCVALNDQVEELSTSLQTSGGQLSAATEELTVREETIRTLHSGTVTPSSSASPVK